MIILGSIGLVAGIISCFVDCGGKAFQAVCCLVSIQRWTFVLYEGHPKRSVFHLLSPYITCRAT